MVDQPIQAYFLRKRPQVTIDGNPEKISSQSLSLLMYIADNGDSEYNREELATLLYGGSEEAREKLRREALFRLPKPLRNKVFGNEGRNIIQFVAEGIWVDSREFAQQAHELLQEGSAFKKRDYLRAKEVLQLYHDAFGLDFNPPSAKQTDNNNFLKWKNKRQQKLADLYHYLLDRTILYCLRQKSLWAEAELYAEKWLGSINPGAMPLQYLIWLAANQQSPRLESYLEELQEYESQLPILGGYTSSEWRARLKNHRQISLSIFDPQARDETHEFVLPATEADLLGRTDTIQEILTLFQSSSEGTVFAITGLPGVGKSQIARTAAQALRKKSETYKVIELELTLDVNLEQLCNTILGELGRNEVLALDYGAKRRRLKQLMHSPNLFIVVDEGHTNAFADPNMLRTVLDLVEGARVMVVARQMPQFDRYLMEINGFDWEQTKTFFVGRIPRLSHLSDSQFQDIAALTGGLPLLLQIITGFMKKELSRTTSLIDRLKFLSEDADIQENAVSTYGAILDWLFQYMDSKERDLLYTISLFSPTEGATLEDLTAVFSSVVLTSEKVKLKLNRLVDLCLVEIDRGNSSTIRYRLHPIIFEFVRQRSQESRQIYFPIIEQAYIKTFLAYANSYHDQPARLDEHQQNIIHMLDMVLFNEAHAWAHPQAIEVMNKIYPYLEKCGLYVLAAKLFNRACELGQFDSPALHIETVYRAGKFQYLQTRYETAMQYFEQALELSQQWQLGDQKANIYNIMCYIYLQKNRVEEALQSLTEAEQWAIHFEQYRILYTIWSNMGLCTYRIGQIEKAQKYYLKVIDRLSTEDRSTFSDELKAALLFAQTSLGVTYNDLGKPDEAKNWFQQSMILAQQLDNQERLGYLYLNLGVTYYLTKDYNAANDCFIQGILIADRLQHAELQTQFLWNQGSIASLRFQHKEASHLIRSALIKAENYHIQWIQCRIVTGLGRHYLRMELFDSALQSFVEALRLPQSLVRHTAQALFGLSLSIMLKKYIVGNNDVETTLEITIPVLQSLILPKLPSNDLFFPQIEQAEIAFQQEMEHLPEIARYRITEALKIWLSGQEKLSG